jgi:hypothetical protein
VHPATKAFYESMNIEAREHGAKIAYRDAKIHASYGIIAIIILLTDYFVTGAYFPEKWNHTVPQVAICIAVISSLLNTVRFLCTARKYEKVN